ncbi:MAG: heme ABC transporter substrate-binding protein IsdE [Bacillota bacterium]
MKRKFLGLFCAISLLMLTGCVDQSQPPTTAQAAMTETTAEAEPTEEELRLIATSFSAVTICDMLDLPLIGVPETANTIADKYSEATVVGGSMSPDFEIIASLKPTEVFAPDTLKEQMETKLQAVNVNSMFLNLRSVHGLYESVGVLGSKYDRKELAEEIIGDFEHTIMDFEAEREGKENPTVMILMGFPGSFCEATASSYVGNLVELAGGINVVEDEFDDFVYWNTEELVKFNPDYILWTAHAIPDLVGDMFEKEFATNDIWKHFDAVQEGRVIELDPSLFHMSANFEWAEGVAFLQELFYGE